jgi:hypothetical protein
VAENAEPKNQNTQPSVYSEIDEPFSDGFNWNTLVAMLFIGVVMMPGSIYLGLVAGTHIGGAAEWVTIILFLEIAKRSFIKLKRQELIIIYWAAAGLAIAGSGGQGLFGGPFGAMIWNQFLVQSPQASAIAKHIPTWAVPPAASEALAARTFWHIDWLKPILVMIVTTIFGTTNMMSLGYIAYRITGDIEQLPFPMAPVKAGGATALAETSNKTEGWRWRVFSIGTVIGLIWGAIYVVVPTLSGAFLTESVSIVPIPFIDFTPNIRSVLPAATFAINTDIVGILVGMVVPYWVVVGTFAGGILKNFVLNPILYNYGVIYRWEPGMSLIPTTVAVEFDFWLSAKIGSAVMVGIISIVSIIRKLVTGHREVEESANLDMKKVGPGSGRGDIPIWLAASFWIASATGAIIVVKILVPDFPWYITAFFGLIFQPIMTYVTAKLTGINGIATGAAFPFVREGSIYLSGYKGAAIWFAPIPIGYSGHFAQTFRELILTRTKFVSIVKLQIANFFILMFFSFFFWSLIWKMTQIPSSSYPFVQKMWPYFATMQSLWVSSTLPGGSNMMVGVVTVPKMLIAAGATVAIYIPMVLFKAPMMLFYGFIGGIGGLPTGAYLPFIGAILNKYYFFKRFGEGTWRQYTPILLAGYSCGMGLIAMSSIAVSLITKSISAVVF